MGYPDAESFVTPERARLADASRALVAAVLEVPDASEDELRVAADATEDLVAALSSGGPSAPKARGGRRHDDYLPRSPLVGNLNPVAPPFTYDASPDGIVARGTFGAAYEGPPGYVHGGWVALAFDEALGMANIASGLPGMTARLAIRYRRPTPLHAELRLDAHTEKVDGRRITTTGTLSADDVVTAEAEGLFVQLGAERSLEYFGDRAQSEEPTDPLP